ncbi:MAG: hypothetical protein ACLSVD_13200 [Eggerthellaceae bacterium]
MTCYMARSGVFGTTVNRGGARSSPPTGWATSVSCSRRRHRRGLYGTATGTGDRVSVPLQHAGLYTVPGIISAQYGNAYPRTAECSTPSTTCTAARTASGVRVPPSTTATSRRSAGARNDPQEFFAIDPRRTSAPR